MALILADRVKETTTTTGTGTVTLAGAVTGYQSFTAIGDGNTTYYTIASQSNSEWEVGIGTYTSSGTTLSRTTVLSSSNAGSLVNFSSGTKDVFVTYPAEKSVNVNVTGNTLLNQSTDQGTGVLQVTGQSTFNGAVTDKSLNLQGGNNLVLNSATLVTQNITVTANTYTLSMTGTGTITLSGTSSGTLVGTGASQVVSRTFTPMAGTLTLTPTGSCTTVQLELGSVFSGYTATGGTAVTTTNNINVPSGQVLAGNGTLALPSYSFGTNTNTGFSINPANSAISISVAGVNTGVWVGTLFSAYSGISLNSALNTNLYSDAAGTLAQRNSTNAQTFRTYLTYTDASNYSRYAINTTANYYQQASEAAGTGALKPVLTTWFSSASAPTATNIPAGNFTVWKNTTDGTVKLYANDGGNLIPVTLDGGVVDQQLLGGIEYVNDLIGQVVVELIGLNLGTNIQNIISQLGYVGDLSGVLAKAIGGGSIILEAGSAIDPSLSNAQSHGTGLFFPAVGQAAFGTAGVEAIRIDASQRMGLGTSTPTGKLDINDSKVRVRTAQTPASATASGNQGEICWDSSYVYICVATNSWKRSAIAAW